MLTGYLLGSTRGPRALCPHPAKPQHLPPSARPGPAPSEPAPSPALPAPQKGEDHQHPDGASAENEDKVVRKMVLKHAAPRSTVAAAPSGRTRGASGPPPPGSHRCLQLIGVTLFCTLSKAVSVYRIGPYRLLYLTLPNRSQPPRSMASFQAGDTAPGRVRGARKG